MDKFGPEVVGFLDYFPYISTQNGLRLLWLGLAIGVVWVVGFSLLGSRMGTRELKLLRIAIPLCGVLCFLLGILAFAYYEYQPIPGDPTPYSDYAIPFGLLGIIFFAFSPVIWLVARQDR